MHKYIQNILSKVHQNKYLDCYFLTTPATRQQAVVLARKLKTFRINPIIFLHQENNADLYEDDVIIKFRNFTKPTTIIKDDFSENYPNIIVTFDESSLFKITKTLYKLTKASVILVDNNSLTNAKQKSYLLSISKFVIYQKITLNNFSNGYTLDKFINETDPIQRDDFLLKINLFNENKIKDLRQINLLMIGSNTYLGSEFFKFLKQNNYKVSLFNPMDIPFKNYKSVISKGKFQVVLDFNGLATFATKSDYEYFLNIANSCGLTHYFLMLPEDPAMAKLLKQTVTQNINPQVKLRSIKFDRVYGFNYNCENANKLLDYDSVVKIIKQENYYLICDYLRYLFNQFVNLTLNNNIIINPQYYQFVSMYMIAKNYDNLSKDSLLYLFKTETSEIRKAVFSFLIATK